MKQMLLLLISLLLISSVAMADHIGIYSDATGQSCQLGNIAGQFSTSATVIHKYASGAVGSRFKATFPVGTSFIAFNTPYIVVGAAPTDLSLGYREFLSGCIVLGTFYAIYGVGTLQILPADGQIDILYADCSFAEKSASGGTAAVNVPGECLDNDGCEVAVEPSTWGSVKSLYR